MNKLFTKIATLSVGLAMAIGVGVAVGSSGKDAVVAKADSATISMSERASTLGWSNSIAYTSWKDTSGIFTVTASGGGNNGKWYTSGGGSWRMYSGGTVTISCSNTYTISAVTSSPTCSWTVNAQSASFSPSARTDFTSIEITYSGASSPVSVTGVSLNKNSTSIDVGDTETLTATVSPSDATNKSVTWKSYSDSACTIESSAVASVSSAGVVTGVSAGTAYIQVKTTDGNFTAKCTVTVTTPAALIDDGNYYLSFTYNSTQYYANDASSVNSYGAPLLVGSSSTSKGVYTITSLGGNRYTIQLGSDYLIIGKSDNNGIKFSASLTDSAKWDVTENGTGFNFKNVGYNTRYLSNYQATDVRCYTSSCKVTLEAALTAATINGASEVVMGSSWSPTSVTEDVGGATVTGMTFAFAASNGATLTAQNTSTGAFTSSTAGTVTVSATKSGYSIASKTVTVVDNSPYINLTKTETEGFTGGNESISFTYGNLNSTLGVSSSNTSIVTVGTPSASAGSGTVQINFVAAGSTTVKFKDGSTELASLDVSVAQSEVTSISLDKASTSLSVGGSTTLTATVVVVGTASDAVSWSTDDSSVATISSTSGTTITVTGAGLGSTTITAEASDGQTATCTVTVALLHTYTFGETANTQQCNDIDTIHSISPACFSGETTLYGNQATNCVRIGGNGTTGSFVYTLPDNGGYITSVILSVKAWSSSEQSSISVIPSGGSAVNYTYTDYSSYNEHTFEIPVAGQYTEVTVTNASGRAYISEMKVSYAYKDPEITSTANNFEIAKSTSQSFDLTFTNYASTPTVTYQVTSGASSVTSVSGYNSLTNNVATVTITASATTGNVTIRFTGTYGTQTTHIDINFEVISPKTIESLEITTQGTRTFVEDDLFSVGSLVLTATFSDESTVVYSAANDNLGLLTFDPALGASLTTSDTSVTVYVTAYGDGVFQLYSITVNEKPYATLVENVSNLWDGQLVYFGSDSSAAKVGAPHSGGNNMGSVSGAYVEDKGLSINDTSGAQVYTVGRVKIGDNVYYTFSFVSNDTLYYLSDTGTSSNNYLGRSASLSDKSGNCTYFSISISDGAATITSKTNTNTPYLRWNNGSSVFACYKASSTTMTDPYLFMVTGYDGGSSAASAFESNRMHMEDYTSSQGWCLDTDEHHYYSDAKEVWNAMSTTERGLVSSAAKDRLAAWATANGDSFDGGTGAIASSAVVNPLSAIANSNGATLIIIVASIVSLTAIGGYFLFKKKKQN